MGRGVKQLPTGTSLLSLEPSSSLTLIPVSTYQGIVFSVRPPRKSWKNISNLSGGEKTLSSLSLVFALHHFKPTPLYVMDEIDAALGEQRGGWIWDVCGSGGGCHLGVSLPPSPFSDHCQPLTIGLICSLPLPSASSALPPLPPPLSDFKNVSIVGHYIKDRTRDAQFIIISLRNNMFELADRLVGIYKTDNATKTVTINPAEFTVGGSGDDGKTQKDQQEGERQKDDAPMAVTPTVAVA